MKKLLVLIGFPLLFGCASQTRVDELQKDIDFAAIKLIENGKELKKLQQDVADLQTRVSSIDGSNLKRDREIEGLIDEVKTINNSMDRLFLKFNQK